MEIEEKIEIYLLFILYVIMWEKRTYGGKIIKFTIG